MITRKTLQVLIDLLLISMMVSGCGKTGPTPVAPENIVLAITPTPFPTPENTPAAGCAQGSDCVFAYRADQCCDCGRIYNREEVESNRWLHYFKDEDYDYKKFRWPDKPCPGVMCSPCYQPPFALVCNAGTCREALTWQEILPACPQQGSQNEIDWCYFSTAVTAYKAGEEEQAKSICKGMTGFAGGDVPKTQECLMQLARAILPTNPQRAVEFCRANLDRLLAMCLKESGETLGQTDVEAGLAVCTEISPDYADGRSQKDACYHNIAMTLAKKDIEQAKVICSKVSEDSQRCLDDLLIEAER
jgi:hypothetical protein